MKSMLISAVAAVLTVSAAIAGDDKGRVKKTLDLADFERISISGVYDLSVKVGGPFSITISGPADEVDRVKATVSEGVLSLDQKERKRGWGGRKRHGVDAEITMPALNGLDVSGVVDGTISDVDADAFRLAISGVGDISLAGRCDSLDATVSGVGDLDADKLECRIVDVSVSGVGDAAVFASEAVDAKVSGMGDIDVYGGPERVSKSNSMFAEVTVH